MPLSSKKYTEIKAFIIHLETETIINFRQIGITNRHLIINADYPISVNIQILDISRANCTILLGRTIENVSLAFEITQCN
ncbi:hypothetical protein D3C73_1381990 [compost metagenome]